MSGNQRLHLLYSDVPHGSVKAKFMRSDNSNTVKLTSLSASDPTGGTNFKCRRHELKFAASG